MSGFDQSHGKQQPYDADLDALASSGSTGSGAFARATAPQVANLNLTDAALSFNGAKVQCFAIEIVNTAGTLQHRIFGERVTPTASAYADKISGASATLANTPSVNSGTPFVSGGGIDASSTSRFVFDTAAQDDAKYFCIASLEHNTTATDVVRVNPRNVSLNINGVTRNRFAIQFTTSAGAAHAITTTNIGAGAGLRARLLVLLA